MPQPVLQHLIPKAGQAGKFRCLGIPTVYDRVCQQALLNRLEPIFEPVLDAASFGHRPGRSSHDALRKIWGELQEGYEWVVNADLKDFFGSVVGPTRTCPARTTDTADPHIVPGPLANIFLVGQAGGETHLHGRANHRPAAATVRATLFLAPPPALNANLPLLKTVLASGLL